jgi:hypothetical protein
LSPSITRQTPSHSSRHGFAQRVARQWLPQYFGLTADVVVTATDVAIALSAERFRLYFSANDASES